MPITSAVPRSERIVARITAADKLTLEQAAAIEGRSLSSFVVEHLRAVACEVIEKEQVLHLNREESRRFAEILTTPPRPSTKAFLEAYEDYRRSVVSEVNPIR